MAVDGRIQRVPIPTLHPSPGLHQDITANLITSRTLISRSMCPMGPSTITSHSTSHSHSLSTTPLRITPLHTVPRPTNHPDSPARGWGGFNWGVRAPMGCLPTNRR